MPEFDIIKGGVLLDVVDHLVRIDIPAAGRHIVDPVVPEELAGKDGRVRHRFRGSRERLVVNQGPAIGVGINPEVVVHPAGQATEPVGL